jgi:hypothetical protein
MCAEEEDSLSSLVVFARLRSPVFPHPKSLSGEFSSAARKLSGSSELVSLLIWFQRTFSIPKTPTPTPTHLSTVAWWCGGNKFLKGFWYKSSSGKVPIFESPRPGLSNGGHPRRGEDCSAGQEPHEGINLAATDLVLQVRGPRASSIELKSVLQLKIWRASSPTSSSVLQVKSSLEGINLAATDLVLQVRGPRASSIERERRTSLAEKREREEPASLHRFIINKKYRLGEGSSLTYQS